MEASTALPAGGISDGELARLSAGAGPYLTVYLGLDPSVERAGELSRLRWDAERAAAAADGAPERALVAVDAFVGDAHRHGRTLAAIADGGGNVHVEHLSRSVPDLARWTRLPSLAPLIEERQHDVPYLAVDVDRERAEDVAARVVAAVDREHAHVVLVAGDVRAVDVMERAMPERVRALVHHVEGGFAAGASATEHAQEEHSSEVRRLVATAAAEETVALARRLEQELGRHDLAVAGADATVAALARGQVHTLLVHDDPDDDRNAFIGDEPVAIAVEPEGLPTPGPDGARPARLVDACIRAAFGGGASVRVVPVLDALPDGVGALLRWPA